MKLLNYSSVVSPSRCGVRRIKEFKFDEVRRIGVGGMATVYREVGRHDSPIAVKLSRAKNKEEINFWSIFQNEANVLRALHEPEPHPNIVRCYGVGETPDGYFLLLEPIDAKNLAQHIHLAKFLGERAPFYLAEALDIIERTTSTVAHIHQKGYVHGDLKPENILYHDSTVLKIIDFALARPSGQKLKVEERRIVGTKEFLSQSRQRGAAPVKKDDIIALGLTFYRMMASTEKGMRKLPDELRTLFKDMVDGKIESCEEVLESVTALRPQLL